MGWVVRITVGNAAVGPGIGMPVGPEVTGSAVVEAVSQQLQRQRASTFGSLQRPCSRCSPHLSLMSDEHDGDEVG